MKPTKEYINLFEESLKRHKRELEKRPNSLFYQGLVRNLEEYLRELKSKDL